ncbi:biotin-dependent carboxyltransferase family protein [Cytobacillus sp. FJAT-54145]|uniref:Biotin-dependent carboxyltransferase family protein n=1 Tax=Cytobacillus spartinae TaxID=3299023 RepID=A0ABW6K5R2_9BACI
MGIKVIKPGLYTTIQDSGRFGYQQFGIVTTGVMDFHSYRLANWLVGNNSNEAVIEMTMIGPILCFEKDAVISVCGADMNPRINNQSVPIGRPLWVRKGQTLSFGRLSSGCRGYLAVHGGIKVPDVLGSKSTYDKGGIGGLRGTPLKVNDQVPIAESRLNNPIKWNLSSHWFTYDHSVIRFLEGKQFDWFTDDSKRTFMEETFTIQSNSDRMGFRLNGKPLFLKEKKELITEGVTFGSVQVPSNGQPIILMADKQTTGGYPKIAQIASIDLPLLAQKKPGESILFKLVSLEEAQRLYVTKERELRVIKRMIKEKLMDVIDNEN